LSKQGDKGLVLNLWRKRWFQLDNNARRMYYYKSKSKEELQGYIDLQDVTGVDHLEPKDSFSFVVHTRDREWKLAATSDVDKQSWMKAIQASLVVKKSAVQPVSFSDAPTSRTVVTPRKGQEDLGIFEFEGEDFGSPVNTIYERDDDPSKPYVDDDLDFDEHYAPPAPPNPTPKVDRSFLVGSVPVNVPRLASTWQPSRNWTYSDSEDTANEQFEQPHEMVAKTYKENFLETGIDFSKPKSYNRRLETII